MAMLVVYLQKTFDFSSATSIATFGAVTTLFYMMPLIGGVFVDKFGKRENIICGSLLVIIGLLLTSIHQYNILLSGLSLFIVGGALGVPAYFCLLGDLYKKNDMRRDSGFTLMYIIMNVGFAVATILGSFIAEKLNYATTNLLVSFAIIFSLALYLCLLTNIQKQIQVPEEVSKFSLKNLLKLALFSIILSIIILVLLIFKSFLAYFILAVLICALIGGANIYIFKTRSNPEQKKKIILFYILCFISLGFWTFYFLGPTLLTVFSQHNVKLDLFNLHIPPESIFSLDMVFVVLTGFVLTKVWLKLDKIKKNPSLPTKFTFAPLWVAIGYGILFFEIYFNPTGLMNLSWMVLAYFFFTLGELFLAPIGFSMAGKLAPKGTEGFFMGVWQVSIGGAATISSLIASSLVMPADSALLESNTGYMHGFLQFTGIGLGMFIFALIFLPWMKRLIK